MGWELYPFSFMPLVVAVRICVFIILGSSSFIPKDSVLLFRIWFMSAGINSGPLKSSSVSWLSGAASREEDTFLYYWSYSFCYLYEKLGFTFDKSRNGMLGQNLPLEVWVFNPGFGLYYAILFSFWDRLLNILPNDWFWVEAALYTEALFEANGPTFMLQLSLTTSLLTPG